jgi:hypothetical protein
MKVIHLPIAAAFAIGIGMSGAPASANSALMGKTLSDAVATAGSGEIVEVRDRRRRGHRGDHYRRANVGDKYYWRHFGPSRHHAKHHEFTGRSHYYGYSPYFYGGFWPYSSYYYW